MLLNLSMFNEFGFIWSSKFNDFGYIWRSKSFSMGSKIDPKMVQNPI